MDIELDYTTINPEGYSVALHDNTPVLSLGVLPGERALVEIRKKKNKTIGFVKEIIKKSEFRVENKEDHYLSCSPFQISTYENQVELKKEMLKKAFLEYANHKIEIDNFYTATEHFGYRNKLELSFVGGEEIELNFAFFERNKKFRRIALYQGCALGSEKMNKVAMNILKWLRENKFTEYDLKTLTVRESKFNGEVIATLLFKKEEKFELTQLTINPISKDNLDGIIIGYSSPKSPASNLDKVLFSKGKDYLEEEILGKKFLYPQDGFFQNNLELFPIALNKMRDFLRNLNITKPKILELYCGVGTIGLSLADLSSEIIGVEIVEPSVEYADRNAELNGIKNFKAMLSPSEKIDPELFAGVDVLILDPSRPGLHPKLIKMIIEAKPKYIIYLSCNPSSQARDFNDLKSLYEIKTVFGFDFYPNTLHLESLAFLTLSSTPG